MSFSGEILNLESNKIYFIRAFAVSAYGVSYSSEITIETWVPMLDIIIMSKTNASILVKTDCSLRFGAIKSRGLLVSTVPGGTIGDQNTVAIPLANEIGFSTHNVLNLIQNTRYYITAYASSINGISYSDQESVYTNGVPIISSVLQPTLVTTNSLTSGGVVASTGGSPIIRYGIIARLKNVPQFDDIYKTIIGSSTSFSTGISGLLPDTNYKIYAYAVNEYGAGYSEVYKDVTTEGAPVLDSIATISSTNSSALVRSNIVKSYATIVERGILYNEDSDLLSGDYCARTKETTSQIGQFTLELSGLKANTKYFIRSYAKNNLGMVGYFPRNIQEQYYFLTGPSVPEVGETYATFIDDGNASVLTKILNTGGPNETIIEKGVLLSDTAIHPTLTNYEIKVQSQSLISDGKFSSAITGMINNLTYNIVGYAINSIGVSYGYSSTVISRVISIPELIFTPIVNKETINSAVVD